LRKRSKKLAVILAAAFPEKLNPVFQKRTVFYHLPFVKD
jgi:hypothetical protein